MKIDLKLVAYKFLKGAIFGGGSALFSIDISAITLHTVDDYRKLGIIALIAVLAGILHGIWNVGKQYFNIR